MSKVGPKGQITLPRDQMKQAGIHPGDEYTTFLDDFGHIVVIKRVAGKSEGVLRNIRVGSPEEIDLAIKKSVTRDE